MNHNPRSPWRAAPHVTTPKNLRRYAEMYGIEPMATTPALPWTPDASRAHARAVATQFANGTMSRARQTVPSFTEDAIAKLWHDVFDAIADAVERQCITENELELEAHRNGSATA
jgi:hypothetical protein